MSAITRRDLGPLTTVFTAPEPCNTPVLNLDSSEVLLAAAHTCVTQDELGIIVQPGCIPREWASANFPDNPDTVLAYSPGLRCPAGHSPACTISASGPQSAEREIFGVLRSGETAVGCCPTFELIQNRSFECDVESKHWCTATYKSGDVVSGFSYDLPSCSSSLWSYKVTATDFGAGTTLYAQAPRILLVNTIAQTQSASSAGDSSSTISRAAGSTALTPDSGENNVGEGLPSSETRSDSGGFGGGTIAGIVIGSVGGLAIVVVTIFIALKWSRQRRRTVAEVPGDIFERYGKAELDGSGEPKHAPHRPEAGGKGPQEVAGSDVPEALGSVSFAPQEIDGMEIRSKEVADAPYEPAKEVLASAAPSTSPGGRLDAVTMQGRS